jgi:hypothetical protein
MTSIAVRRGCRWLAAALGLLAIQVLAADPASALPTPPGIRAAASHPEVATSPTVTIASAANAPSVDVTVAGPAPATATEPIKDPPSTERRVPGVVMVSMVASAAAFLAFSSRGVRTPQSHAPTTIVLASSAASAPAIVRGPGPHQIVHTPTAALREALRHRATTIVVEQGVPDASALVVAVAHHDRASGRRTRVVRMSDTGDIIDLSPHGH